VEVYAISAASLIGGKGMKDIQATLEKNAENKLNWIKKRVVEICREVKKVSKWEHVQEEFDSKMSEVTRKFPTATKATMNNFVNTIPEDKLAGHNPKNWARDFAISKDSV